MKTNAEASRLFDELYTEPIGLKFHRRKMTETLNRIRTWFNKELSSTEFLPQEFNEVLQTHRNLYQPLSQNLSYEVMKMNILWSKAL